MSTTRRYLLIGCGYARDRRIDPRAFGGRQVMPRRDFSDGELYTLDQNAKCGPDLVADLEQTIGTDWRVQDAVGRVPFLAHSTRETILPSTFDEVHAYEVLEHLGRQGEVESFFASFEPIYHVLKPGGFLCATVPSIHSPWAWADPGHRRIITAGTLLFLDRLQAVKPPSSDYRSMNPCDFRLQSSFDNGESLAFVLEAVKPARKVPA